eukprot:1003141-Prymnesium_polylepis.1
MRHGWGTVSTPSLRDWARRQQSVDEVGVKQQCGEVTVRWWGWRSGVGTDGVASSDNDTRLVWIHANRVRCERVRVEA